MCNNCYEKRNKDYENKLKDIELHLQFKGFGRYSSETKIMTKIGVNNWDSLIFSDPISTDYFRVKLKILKMREKDPSGLVIGMLKGENMD